MHTVAAPTPSFPGFAYTQTQAVQTATAVAPLAATPTYAAPYSSLSSLAPKVSTTTYGNWQSGGPQVTSVSEPYGTAAWTSMWQAANPVNFTRGIYSTTVAPYPIPTAELIRPDPLYFGPKDCRQFPKGFMFGVAGSAGQIEGAVADEGKTPTGLDVAASQVPGFSDNYAADENYYLYKVDIERLAAMGIKYYSFSISWARIFPFVDVGSPLNEAGLKHYDDLINFCLEKGIQPVVTLLHADTPLALFQGNMTDAATRSEFNTYTNGGFYRDNFIETFVQYGKVVMAHFADRVPFWVTFNEPWYGTTNAKAVYGVIRAHAELYHYYHDTLNGTGSVTYKSGGPIGIPLDPTNATHVDASCRYNDFYTGAYANPIYLGQDYPETYKETVKDYVPLNQSDLDYFKGTAGKRFRLLSVDLTLNFLFTDLFAIDLYTANLIQPLDPSSGRTTAQCSTNKTDPAWPNCVTFSDVTENGWQIGYRSNAYTFSSPRLTRIAMNYLWNTYKTPLVYTEFGFPVFAEAEKDLDAQRYDTPRSNYYLSVMSELLAAIWEDGIDLRGAFAWSFLDNWEFGSYEEHYGLQAVNRTTQVRSFKRSFFDYVEFFQARVPQ